MFWIVDSILMHKRKKSSPPGIHYHRSSARYNRLKYNVESGSESESSDSQLVYKKTSHSNHLVHGRQLTSPVRTQPLAVGDVSARERETVDTRLDSTEL